MRRHVRRIDDGQATGSEPSTQLLVQPAEREAGRPLVGFVAGEHPSIGIGGEDLVRAKVAGRERGLAGAGRADEHDQARVRDLESMHPLMMRPATALVRKVG